MLVLLNKSWKLLFSSWRSVASQSESNDQWGHPLNCGILQAQEDAFNNKTTELTAKSEDQSIGLVTRNKVCSQPSNLLIHTWLVWLTLVNKGQGRVGTTSWIGSSSSQKVTSLSFGGKRDRKTDERRTERRSHKRQQWRRQTERHKQQQMLVLLPRLPLRFVIFAAPQSFDLSDLFGMWL